MSRSNPRAGSVGVARSPLRPSGKVELHGKTWDARADAFVEAGAMVVVVEVGRFGLVVRPAAEGETLEPTPPSTTGEVPALPPVQRDVRFVVQLLIGAIVGMALGAVHAYEVGSEYGRAVVTGLGFGLLYAVLMREVYAGAHDGLSAAWPVSPGWFTLAVWPVTGFALGLYLFGPNAAPSLLVLMAMLAAPLSRMAVAVAGALG